MNLTAGLHAVPNGHLAAVVTYLQMTSRQMVDAPIFPTGTSATNEQLGLAEYRSLFRLIGTPWLWCSRLMMSDQVLAKILEDTQVETFVVRQNSQPIGLIELDFRISNACELAFFGLATDATGKGLGGAMMVLAQERAFSRPIERFHVHTCTLDAPQALGFYQKAGFTAYKRGVEIMPDPRMTGTLPALAAEHIPCLP